MDIPFSHESFVVCPNTPSLAHAWMDATVFSVICGLVLATISSPVAT